MLTKYQTVLDDPMSEEKQGKNIVGAASAAGVQCFLWSTLPSSHEISNGKFVTRLYEGLSSYCWTWTWNLTCLGKYSVDAVIREACLPGAFIRTGNFYENMILRNYASYDKDSDTIIMRRPIITAEAEST